MCNYGPLCSHDTGLFDIVVVFVLLTVLLLCFRARLFSCSRTYFWFELVHTYPALLLDTVEVRPDVVQYCFTCPEIQVHVYLVKLVELPIRGSGAYRTCKVSSVALISLKCPTHCSEVKPWHTVHPTKTQWQQWLHLFQFQTDTNTTTSTDNRHWSRFWKLPN